MAKFTSETAKAARQKWAAKYEGTEEHKEWASQGYWSTGQKYGFKIANKLISGQHLTKAEYKKMRKTSN